MRMKKLNLIFSLFVLGSPFLGSQAQSYQVFFPGGGSVQQSPFQQSIAPSQSAYARQGPLPQPGEVLGNFFNGQAPQQQQPSAQPNYVNSFRDSNTFHNLNRIQPEQPREQFPFRESNFLSPPASTSIPRQTSFFGNNYDFFRQFHTPLGTPPSNQQQLRGSSFGSSGQYQNQGSFVSAVRPQNTASSPVSSFGSFGAGTLPTSPIPSPSSSSPTAAVPTHSSTQFFSSPQPTNGFTFSTFGTPTAVSPTRPGPSVAPPQPQPQTYSNSPAQPQAQFPSPAPQEEPQGPVVLFGATHRTPVSYPQIVNTPQGPTPAPQNSIYSGYEEAAKALGVTHNLRVVTTETLAARPSLELASAIQETSASPVPALTEPSQYLSQSPQSSSEVRNLAPEPIPTEPVPVPTTAQTEPPPTTTSQPPKVSRTPATVIRVKPNRPTPVRSTTTTPTSTTTATSVQEVEQEEAPRLIVVPSRPRQPLFRHGSRVVAPVDNTLEELNTPRPTHSVRTTPTSTQPPPQAAAYFPVETPQPRRQPPSNSGVQLNQFGVNPQRGVSNAGVRPGKSGPAPLAGPHYYSGLAPGNLYTNTNGAYQGYYDSQQQQPETLGLEEIEPQTIELKIPRRNTPVQELDPYFQNNRFSSPQPQPQLLQVVTEAPEKPFGPDNGEVYRVGPKGRLLKKRRRQRLHSVPAQTVPPTAALLTSPPYEPSEPTTADVPRRTSAPSPTTYRPRFNALDEQNEAVDEVTDRVTTYRSKFRYSPRASTTEASVVDSSSSAQKDEGSAPSNAKLIESRLKSLERQIRFKNRKNTT